MRPRLVLPLAVFAFAFTLLLTAPRIDVANSASETPFSGQTLRSGDLPRLPPQARAVISATLGRSQTPFFASTRSSQTEARNEVHHLSANFSTAGVNIAKDGKNWQLALQSYGYDENSKNVLKASPVSDTNRVEFRRGDLTEWYVNGPLGLEQGVTIQNKSLQRHRTLTVSFSTQGDLLPKVEHGGKSLTLVDSKGVARLHYGDLFALDAHGKELPVSIEASNHELVLRANVANACYPITIDPFIQAAELTSSSGKSGAEVGLSVAISGNTAVVGSFGMVYVFVEPPTGWVNATQTTQLFEAGGLEGSGFGFAVSISGNTVVVGAHSENTNAGSAYVYVEPPTGWPAKMGQTAKLTASDAHSGAELGRSVSISGNTIVAGAQNAAIEGRNEQGAAYVFVEPSSGWIDMTETAKLTASDGIAGDKLGYSVGVNGSTVVAGAPSKGSTSSAGATYVFVEPTTGWTNTTQTAKLTASDGLAGDRLGNFVGVYGTTVVAGAPAAAIGKHHQQGAAYVFVAPSTGWADMTQTAKLTSSDGVSYGFFGRAVAISNDIIIVGAPAQTVNGDTGQGAVYEYSEPPTGWVDMTQTAELNPGGAASNDFFGDRIGIDGNNAVIGAAGWTVSGGHMQGAAFIFTGP